MPPGFAGKLRRGKPDFDAGQFVLGKVRPMVCGLFPAKERQVMLDLFERALVFFTNIAFAKREVFAYACEAYSRILEQSRGPADRRRLYASYVKNGVPDDDRISRDELVDVVASAVDARNGWKRILAHCSPPGMVKK